MAVIPRLFNPAIRLLDRLRYPWKFSLISLCFALPIALLIYMLFSEIGERIDFAAKEAEGVAYLRALAGVRDALHQAALAWNDPAESRLAAAAASLATAEQQLGPRLGTETRWQELDRLLARPTKPQADPEQRRAFLEQAIAQVRRLNAGVGNQSNLILDPDLDTYYLMDAVVLKLPEFGDIAAAIGLLADGRAGETAADSAGRRARLLVLAGRLNSLSEELNANLDVAFTASLAPSTALSLRPALLNLRAAVLDAAGPLEAPAAEGVPLEPARYAAAASALLTRALALWDAAAGQLDDLLAQRIERFQKKRHVITGFVAAVVLVVLYLFIGFYLAVMRMVSRLDQAARALAAGEAAPSLALSNRDELGQVVHAFNRVAAALIESNHANRLLNERLAEDNRHMAAELDVTRRLQQMILPRDEELRKIRELDIAGFMEPAAHVGGDYYDVLVYEGGVKIGIGDVTGHGLESGVLMIMVQTAVRTLLANQETDTVKFFSALNRAIYDNVRRMDSDKNLSLALVEYHEGLLHLSGQHEEMIVVRADGHVERIDTMDLGFPIGLDEDISAFIAKTQVRLEPGDGVVLYTDGITEAANAQRQLYGLERLCAVLSREWSRAAAEIREAVVDDLRRHIDGHTVYDDITLLIIKQNPRAHELS
jgi:sigma-B regulation protein RsbU (phosphoserine phosphatase)